MDIETAKRLQYHDWLHHESKTQGKSECLRIRVNGAPKTWKTRPDEIRLPVRWGARARDQFALYEYEIGEWEPEGECRNPNHPKLEPVTTETVRDHLLERHNDDLSDFPPMTDAEVLAEHLFQH